MHAGAAFVSVYGDVISCHGLATSLSLSIYSINLEYPNRVGDILWVNRVWDDLGFSCISKFSSPILRHYYTIYWFSFQTKHDASLWVGYWFGFIACAGSVVRCQFCLLVSVHTPGLSLHLLLDLPTLCSLQRRSALPKCCYWSCVVVHCTGVCRVQSFTV